MSLPERTVPRDPVLDVALVQLEALVDSFEEDPDPAVRERAVVLLQAVDAVHRPGLARIMALLEAADRALLKRAIDDPAIHVLLDLYELLPAAPAAGPTPTPPPAGFVPLTSVQLKPRRHGVGR